MATEGLRKHTTTLFHSVLSAQVTRVSRVLENHRNLPNHQIAMTAADTLTGGKWGVYIIPDADRVNAPVDTGLVLDLTDRDSAILNFTGVIRGIVLRIVEPVPEPSVRMSAVISSFSRYKKTAMTGGSEDRLDYVSSDLGAIDSDFTTFARSAENHSNLVYHQLALTSDIPLEATYRLRIMPDTEGESLEATVDTGHLLEFSSSQSVLMRFGGIIRGIHIQREDGGTAGGEVRIVLSSAVERFDELVYDFIGVTPELGDHITDYNNPHQTSWDNLLNKPSAFLNSTYLEEPLIIPDRHQFLVWEKYEINGGSLQIAPGGKLIVLHDRPETRAIEPDFTYNMGGSLTQIDYASGEQKTFSYNGGGQLEQVDVIRDGTTLRKTFTYTGGGELDFITEDWL